MSRSKSQHQHFADETLDADAALADLDTVESALRRRRDAAARDEKIACEDLRTARNASAKRRDILLGSAQDVSSQVTNLATSGRQASSALRTDLSSLKTASRKLAALQDARDLLSLLMHSSSNNVAVSNSDVELDAVRVSRLLARASDLLENGSMDGIMGEVDITRAKTEVRRCQKELATNVLDCMKKAIGKGGEGTATGKYGKKTNIRLITECAAAAEQLGVSQQFVETYVQSIFPFNEDSDHIGGMQHGGHGDSEGGGSVDIDYDTDYEGDRRRAVDKVRKPVWRMGGKALPLSTSSHVILGTFRSACWSSVSIVREHAATILEAFHDPYLPLATMLKMVVQRKVLVVANSILSSLSLSIHHSEQRLRQLKSTSNEGALATTATESSSGNGSNVARSHNGGASSDARRLPSERIRNLTISDSKETWREHAQRLSEERIRYLNVCADIFTSLSKLKADLLQACRGAGLRTATQDMERVFEQPLKDMKKIGDEEIRVEEDPYLEFRRLHLGQYLEIQKTWMDDQLGASFFDITRIDMHAPRLAPRERSNSDVYQRYRAFYGQVSSSFQQMTQRAIQSTNECIRRTVAVLSCVSTVEHKKTVAEFGGLESDNIFTEESGLATRRAMTSCDGGDPGKDEQDVLKRQFSGYEEEKMVRSKEDYSSEHHSLTPSSPSSQIAQGPRTMSEMRAVVRELLNNLVRNYVANVETLLQAATHLLPVCEEDAKMAQLWMSGASPLTAYVQAIEVLAKSNVLIKDFILSLDVDVSDQHQHHQFGTEDDYGPITMRSMMTTTATMTDLMSDGYEDMRAMATDKNMSKFVPIESRDVLHSELASGLSDLSAEAQAGVQAAIKSLQARLFAMLTTKQATSEYMQEKEKTNHSDGLGPGEGNRGNYGAVFSDENEDLRTRTTLAYKAITFDEMTTARHVGMHIEPSAAFINVSTFIEQQLLSVVSSMSSENKDVVIMEIGRVMLNAVLQCWCLVDGIVHVKGALQMIEDGKTIMRVFQEHVAVAQALECLPVIGQLFLQPAEDLWCCVESGALADVDANVIVTLLKKRDDFESERVTKVCQSLGS